MRDSMLHQMLQLTDVSLACRRDFLGFSARDIELLAHLRSWAEQVADPMITEFYDFQFQHPDTFQFFQNYAQQRGMTLQQLRKGLESASARYARCSPRRFRQQFKQVSR